MSDSWTEDSSFTTATEGEVIRLYAPVVRHSHFPLGDRQENIEIWVVGPYPRTAYPGQWVVQGFGFQYPYADRESALGAARTCIQRQLAAITEETLT